MPDYKNKETGEVRRLPRVRTYYHENGTTTEVNMDDTSMDMTAWELFVDDTSYDSIRMSKAHTDGNGIR